MGIVGVILVARTNKQDAPLALIVLAAGRAVTDAQELMV